MREMIYKTVVATAVNGYLRLGWQVVLPSRWHPVGDAYARVPIQWLCQCPSAEPEPDTFGEVMDADFLTGHREFLARMLDREPGKEP